MVVTVYTDKYYVWPFYAKPNNTKYVFAPYNILLFDGSTYYLYLN